jgi:ABC-type polysaccharide/polyol phosphate transport system ATPase subunit
LTEIGTIEVHDVWKTFRIFRNRNTTLKQALIRRQEQFEEFWAVRDVSFTIDPGSTFGFVGANGAGKSTVLKMLARILVPDSGRIDVNGKVSALLELGAGFHPELSGRENIFLNGSILGMSTASLRQKYDEIVEFAGLENFIEQPVKTYSSGMYSRLGFSVAVAVDPDILLVDEVLAVGDEEFQRRCAEKMSELRSGGRTVVVVSHSLAQVQQLCDRAAWLDHGALKLAGKTEDVVEAYLASVTTAYRLDSQGRERYGSGEAQLEVELLAPDGASSQFVSGQPMTVRFHIEASERMRNVVLGFLVHSSDGYIVAGGTTRYQSELLTVEAGHQHIDLEIPSLVLLNGSYHLDASISDRDSQHIYDRSPHIARFDVIVPTNRRMFFGPADLGGEWKAGR